MTFSGAGRHRLRARLRSPVISPVLKGGVARAATLPISVVLNLVTAKLLLDAVGPTRYGVILLVANFATLVPFADFGISAPVISEVAAARESGVHDRVGRVLQSSLRVLMLSAACLVALAVCALQLGAWPLLLGEAAEGSGIAVPASVAVSLIALGLPFSIGERVLIGTDRSHMAVGAALVAPLVSLGGVATLSLVGAPAGWFATTVPLGLLTASLLNFALAARLTDFRLWGHLGRCLGRRRLQAIALRRQAGPMFLLTIATPLALHSDRLVLSHRSTADELTSYTLAYQIYAPGLGVAAAAATALWPILVRRRSRRDSNVQLWQGAVLAFSGFGLFLAFLIVLGGPVIVRWLTDAEHVVPGSLFVVFGTLLVVQLAALPSTVLLTTEAGLRWQAGLAIVSAVGNVSLSWVLAARYGAVGPVVASLLFALMLQLIPLSLYARRRAFPREARGGTPLEVA